MAANSILFQKAKATLVEGVEVFKNGPAIVAAAWQQGPGLLTALCALVILGAVVAWSGVNDQLLLLATGGVVGAGIYVMKESIARRPLKGAAGKLG